MTETTRGSRRKRWSWIVYVALFLIIGIPLTLFAMSSLQPPPPAEAVEYTAIPVHVKHVTGTVGDRTVNRGYIVITPKWAAMADTASLNKPATNFGSFEPAFLRPSQTLKSVCEIARKRGEPVTFVGKKARNQEHDGLPVLVVEKVVYGGEEFHTTFIPGH